MAVGDGEGVNVAVGGMGVNVGVGVGTGVGVGDGVNEIQAVNATTRKMQYPERVMKVFLEIDFRMNAASNLAQVSQPK